MIIHIATGTDKFIKNAAKIAHTVKPTRHFVEIIWDFTVSDTLSSCVFIVEVWLVTIWLHWVLSVDSSYPESQVSHMLTPLLAHILQPTTCQESTLRVTGFWYTSDVSTIVVSIEKV